VLVSAQVSTTYLVMAVVFGVWVPAALSGAPICLGVENRTAAGARIAMVINVVVQAAVLSTVLLVRTPDSVWAVRLIVGGALVALALLPISADYRRAVLRPTWPRRLPSGFWRFAVPAGLAGLVSTLVLSRTEVLFLGHFQTEAAAGIYALAFGVAGHVFAPAEALVGPLVPAVSGLREVDRDHMLMAFERAARGATSLVSLIVAAALAPMVTLIPVFYKGFDAASPFALALGISGAFTVASGVLTAFVMARYSAGQTLVSNLIALAVNLGAAFAFVPAFGVWGAVWANIAGALTRFGLLLRAERRALAIPIGPTLRLWSPLVLAAAGCLAAWWACSAMTAPPFVEAVVAGVTSLGLFVVLMRLTGVGLSSDEISAVTRVVPGRVQRPAHRAASLLLGGRPSHAPD
jgi:O-antigen/teichoic acid export membrane protein